MKKLVFSVFLVSVVVMAVILLYYYSRDQEDDHVNQITPTKDTFNPAVIEVQVGTSEPKAYLICDDAPIFSSPELQNQVGEVNRGVILVLGQRGQAVEIDNGGGRAWIDQSLVSLACF